MASTVSNDTVNRLPPVIEKIDVLVLSLHVFIPEIEIKSTSKAKYTISKKIICDSNQAADKVILLFVPTAKENASIDDYLQRIYNENINDYLNIDWNRTKIIFAACEIDKKTWRSRQPNSSSKIKTEEESPIRTEETSPIRTEEESPIRTMIQEAVQEAGKNCKKFIVGAISIKADQIVNSLDNLLTKNDNNLPFVNMLDVHSTLKNKTVRKLQGLNSQTESFKYKPIFKTVVKKDRHYTQVAHFPNIEIPPIHRKKCSNACAKSAFEEIEKILNTEKKSKIYRS